MKVISEADTFAAVDSHTRAIKALDLIGTNHEGLLWVKIFLKNNLSNPQIRVPQMVPIRWIRISRAKSTTQWFDVSHHESSLNGGEEGRDVDDAGNGGELAGGLYRMFEGLDVEDEQNGTPTEPIGSIDSKPHEAAPQRLEADIALTENCWIHVSRASREAVRAQDSVIPTCAVCLERPSDLQLLPCNHAQFCKTCILESICCWNKAEAPNCPLCRSAFHTMVMIEDKVPEQAASGKI